MSNEELNKENEMLEERIQLLSKELTFLKDIFLTHANRAHGLDSTHLGLGHILKEVDEVNQKTINLKNFFRNIPLC